MVDGERIAPDDTAEKLGLEDEDLIATRPAAVLGPQISIWAGLRPDTQITPARVFCDFGPLWPTSGSGSPANGSGSMLAWAVW
jgi:hypothetical protein